MATYDFYLDEIHATLHIVERKISDGPRDYYKKTRIFVFGVENLPEMVIADLELPAPLDDGVDPENDRAYRRRNHLYASLTKAVALEALRLGRLHPGVDGQGVTIKLRFSQRAGCTCPCSPGVIMDERLTVDGRPIDLFISLQSGAGVEELSEH